MLRQFNKWNLYLLVLVLVSVSKLQNNNGLRCLNFSMNGVGHDGAQYLGRALRVNRTLQHLDICFGRIPEDGCRYLAASLEINDVLQGLKVKTKENKCTLPYRRRFVLLSLPLKSSTFSKSFHSSLVFVSAFCCV